MINIPSLIAEVEGENGALRPDQQFQDRLEAALKTFPDTESIGCHCHQLELLIKDVLKADAAISSLLATLRRFASAYRNSSPIRLHVTSHCRTLQKEPPSVPHDVATRWSSTFDMIDGFVSGKSILASSSAALVAADAQVAMPGKEELQLLCQPTELDLLCFLQQLLGPIAAQVHTLEADAYPTLSLVQYCAALLDDQLKALEAALIVNTQQRPFFWFLFSNCVSLLLFFKNFFIFYPSYQAPIATNRKICPAISFSLDRRTIWCSRCSFRIPCCGSRSKNTGPEICSSTTTTAHLDAFSRISEYDFRS